MVSLSCPLNRELPTHSRHSTRISSRALAYLKGRRDPVAIHHPRTAARQPKGSLRLRRRRPSARRYRRAVHRRLRSIRATRRARRHVTRQMKPRARCATHPLFVYTPHGSVSPGQLGAAAVGGGSVRRTARLYGGRRDNRARLQDRRCT